MVLNLFPIFVTFSHPYFLSCAFFLCRTDIVITQCNRNNICSVMLITPLSKGRNLRKCLAIPSYSSHLVNTFSTVYFMLVCKVHINTTYQRLEVFCGLKYSQNDMQLRYLGLSSSLQLLGVDILMCNKPESES